MELKRVYIGTPPASAGAEPVPISELGFFPVPYNRKWLIREITVVHHGISGLAPAAYVTVSARPYLFNMSFAQWQQNALMWADGPHWPLSEPTSRKKFFVLDAREELAVCQSHRLIDGQLVDGEHALGGVNLSISALEVPA